MMRKTESQSDYKENSLRIIHWTFAKEREFYKRARGYSVLWILIMTWKMQIRSQKQRQHENSQEQWQRELWSVISGF